MTAQQQQQQQQQQQLGAGVRSRLDSSRSTLQQNIIGDDGDWPAEPGPPVTFALCGGHRTGAIDGSIIITCITRCDS